MRVAAYIRVSTDEQAKGFGLDAQREKLSAYFGYRGWDDIVWFEDAGYSGSNIQRPAMQKMLRQLKRRGRAKGFDYVVTYKADRLSRSLKDLLVLIEDVLQPAKCGFISATEDFNTDSANGKAFLQMLGTFAEFERNMIRERTRSGRRQKAQQKGYAAGSVPLGYSLDAGKLKIEKSEAQAVRLVFQLRQSGKTLQEIADRLNEENVKTKRGGNWHPSTVNYILRNPKYQGVLAYDFGDLQTSFDLPSIKILA